MRRALISIVLVMTSASLAACDPAPAATTTSGGAPSPSPTPNLPSGIPPWFEDDVPAAGVPAAALVPLKDQVTGTWYASTSAGEAIVVAWETPGEDPFRVARGVALWRRFDDGGPPWRPVWATAYPERALLIGIQATTGDVTGDGSDEVVVFAETGGSGGCGTYVVLDAATAATIYRRPNVCDTRLDPDPQVPGLILTEVVYAPGDPHCCPAAEQRTTLVYEPDGTWRVADVQRHDL